MRGIPAARAATVMALACATVTACAPPHGVLVGNRDVATDILLKGNPAAVSAPPVPVQPGFPIAPAPVAVRPVGAVVALPPPPPPELPTCPTANPLVGARDPATPLPPGPPAAATYTFHQSGDFAIKAASTTAGVFAPLLSHTISDVATQTGGGWSYVDKDSSGMSVTYDVFPQQRAAAGEPVSTDQESATPVEAGIYARSFTYKRADGTVDTLAPQPEVLVAPLPLSNAGQTWRSRGVDPSTGIAVVVNGQVGLGKKFSPVVDRIDACGTVLQAYWVQYTVAADNSSTTGVNTGPSEPASSLQGTDLNVLFVGTQVAFATQYGAIPLEQNDLLAGSDGTAQVKIHRTEQIAQGPLPAHRPS